jgi:hypothetical protein
MFHVEYKGTTVKTGTYTQCVEYIQKSTHLCIDDLEVVSAESGRLVSWSI